MSPFSGDPPLGKQLVKRVSGVSILLLRDLLLIIILASALKAVNLLAYDVLGPIRGDGKLLRTMEHWLELAYPALISASALLFGLEAVIGFVRTHYSKLSQEFIKKTVLSARSFGEAILSYVAVFSGATVGYALIQEATQTQRGLAAKFCFYTAGFVLLLEVILLAIRYAYHTAGGWIAPKEAVVA
jgi:hypothetical protein